MNQIGQPHTALAVTASTAQKLATNDGLKYLKAIKDLFHDNKEKYNEFLEVMREFKSQRIDTCGVIARVEELFKDHRELILGFSTFLPDGFMIRVPEEKNSIDFKKANNFVSKIKNRFKNDDQAYKSFVDILTRYKEQKKSVCQVFREMSLLLKNHEDLFAEFLQFLPNNSASTAQNASTGIPFTRRGKLRTAMRTMRQPLAEEMEDRDKNKKRERDHTDMSLERDEERENKRIGRGSPNVSKDAPNQRFSLSSNKDKYNLKEPVLELELSNCKRCTPSYLMLPKNHRTPASSHRTELDASVLNDDWVLVAYEREKYTFNHTRKTQSEEILFKCEDDRFELDMLMESVKSTTQRVEELLEKMKDKIIDLESPFRIEDHLTSQNLRCIERLYGDHGLELMDFVSKNPTVAFPIIISRLKQKQEEWSKCHTDFNTIWSKIYA